MFGKKSMALAIFLVAMLAVLPVCAADNPMGDVAGLEDTTENAIGIEESQIIEHADVDVIGSDNGTFTALQNKINNAPKGSTINLENDYAYNEGFDIDGIRIGDNLTINGNGHTMDGLNKSCVFFIYSQNPIKVVLNNIKFINGYSKSYGGAIYRGNAEFNNCIFENNHGGTGGAVYTSNENVTFNNCRFISNEANRHGGAIYTSRGNVIINKCSFTSNKADRDGGAVYSYGGAVSVENTDFTANVAGHQGGAFYYDGYCKFYWYGSTRLELCQGVIFNSNFNNNFASYGGAIYANSGSYDGIKYGLHVIQCDFKGNDMDMAYKNNFGGITKDCTFDYVIVITANNLKKFYGGPERFTVKLTRDGNYLSDEYVSINVNGKTSKVKTNDRGEASIEVNFAPKSYVATVKYGNVKSTAEITVKKATPQLTAIAKTFKKSDKTKKYAVTLKNSQGKVIKNTQVKITVNKKTYSAKTNSKGVATFKLNKLTKKGSFKATVSFAGNKYYNKVTKKVTLKVK